MGDGLSGKETCSLWLPQSAAHYCSHSAVLISMSPFLQSSTLRINCLPNAVPTQAKEERLWFNSPSSVLIKQPSQTMAKT